MHLLNREFDKVVCINLAERSDKREIMSKKFDDLGIEIQWFTAVKYDFLQKLVDPIADSQFAHFNKNQPFEIGASLSHYHVIKQALEEGAQRIFVFEDDVMFHRDFNSKLDSYWKALPEDWNMVMFYSFMYEILPQNIRVSPRWIKSYKAWSLMAYGMKIPSMETYIALQDKYFTIADKASFDMQEKSNLNIYSAVPTLCVPQTDLGSNIRGTNMNYKNTPTVLNLGYPDSNYI